jgi:hypothetical protein
MDTIEYRCPLHGLVASRSRENISVTEDLQTCPVELHRGQLCGRPLFFEFAHGTDTVLAS